MQLDLPMLTYYTGPRLVPVAVVAAVPSYRQAVRLCWQLRLRTAITRRVLAEEVGLYASHVSEYLSDDETKRELPAKHIAAMEVACGNRAITQWLTRRAGLTILEQFIEPQKVAA